MQCCVRVTGRFDILTCVVCSYTTWQTFLSGAINSSIHWWNDDGFIIKLTVDRSYETKNNIWSMFFFQRAFCYICVKICYCYSFHELKKTETIPIENLRTLLCLFLGCNNFFAAVKANFAQFSNDSLRQNFNKLTMHSCVTNISLFHIFRDIFRSSIRYFQTFFLYHGWFCFFFHSTIDRVIQKGRHSFD